MSILKKRKKSPGGSEINREQISSTDFELIEKFAVDIINSPGMQSEKEFMQHGRISCYTHSLSVANMSIRIARSLRVHTDVKSMIRGALLHDYFLYDWHEPDAGHKLHGFTHARKALVNAERDFNLTDIERDIIVKHMFPMNICLPLHRESCIVTLADKLCALREVFTAHFQRAEYISPGPKADSRISD